MKTEYTIKDLETFHRAGTKFYEVTQYSKNDKLTDIGDPVISSDIINDGMGNLYHVGFRDYKYCACYNEAFDVRPLEICIEGENSLLKWLNQGRLVPVDVYKSGKFFDVDFFDSLNESTAGHQPKLYLQFEPPIYNDAVGIKQIEKILWLIENEYPTVSWFQGQEPSQFNPFVHTEEHEGIPEQIKSLTIGYWPDNPNLLTYGQWDRTGDDNDYGYTNGIDGWMWLKERDVDFDKTSDILDSLNESHISRTPRVGEYVIFVGSENENNWLNVPYTVGKLYKVTDVKYPNDDDELLDGYGTIKILDDNGKAWSYSIELLDGRNWETWFQPIQFNYDATSDIFNQLNESEISFNPEVGDYLVTKDYPAIIKFLGDGLITMDKEYKITEIIPNYGLTIRNDNNHKHSFKFKTADKFFHLIKTNQFSDTENLFHNLNESTEYQPKLNLRFEDGIDDPEYLDKVLKTLALQYPNLKWKGGSSILKYNPIRDVGNDDEWIDTPIIYLTIGFFKTSPNSLTYTDGDLEYADDEHDYENYNWVDGYQWVEDNDVDFDQTSDIFNQLNESVQEKESFTLVFNPPIKDPKTMEEVLMRLAIIHPDWVWVNKEKLTEYSPFDTEIFYDRYYLEYDNVVGNLTINNPEWKHSKGLSWGSDDPDDYSANLPEIDGWEYLEQLGDMPNTEDIFNQLD